jgi:hypothetical protein
MKTKLSIFALASILSGQLWLAQAAEPVNDWKPCPSNQAGKQYPQYNSEGRVKFRIVAPEAKSVGCTFRESSEFTKGEDGAWYGHTRPLDEGFHYYAIKIDGAEVPDPNSRYFYGSSRWGSAVEIPAKDADFYALKNVPHGQLREVYYFSKSSDKTRHIYVYTPPDYDKDTGKRYPVLYLAVVAGVDAVVDVGDRAQLCHRVRDAVLVVLVRQHHVALGREGCPRADVGDQVGQRVDLDHCDDS